MSRFSRSSTAEMEDFEIQVPMMVDGKLKMVTRNASSAGIDLKPMSRDSEAPLAASEVPMSPLRERSAEPMSPLNPLVHLKAITAPEDFVVLKLDIDTASIELRLIEQLLADAALVGRVDELYWEHAVRMSPMMHQGWARDRPTQTLKDSYELFSRLREAGIRAHSWV